MVSTQRSLPSDILALQFPVYLLSLPWTTHDIIPLKCTGTSTPACTVYQELVQADGVSNQNGYNGWCVHHVVGGTARDRGQEFPAVLPTVFVAGFQQHNVLLSSLLQASEYPLAYLLIDGCRQVLDTGHLYQWLQQLLAHLLGCLSPEWRMAREHPVDQ